MEHPLTSPTGERDWIRVTRSAMTADLGCQPCLLSSAIAYPLSQNEPAQIVVTSNLFKVRIHVRRVDDDVFLDGIWPVEADGFEESFHHRRQSPRTDVLC